MTARLANQTFANRRSFLVASGVGFAGLAFGRPGMAAPETVVSPSKPAKSTILFFLCGGASHLDMWDLKSNAPDDYRGPFQPIATSAAGVQISEHLPMLAKQAHHLAIVRSVRGTVNTNDHHAGYYYNLTGHAPDPTFVSLGNNRTPFPDDWPFMGSVVAAKRPAHPELPNAITLPHKPSRLPYTRPGQFAARLGVEHDPLYVDGSVDEPLKFVAPALSLDGDTTAQRLLDKKDLLRTINTARGEFEQFGITQTWRQQQERAVSLLLTAGTTKAFNVGDEPAKLRERYGETVNGMSLLLARRLAEAGVPFITVFWKENQQLAKKCRSAGGWDTHGNNFNCLKEGLLPEFDRAFSALIEDLHDRGMLDETLLLVNSEMGRKPKIGDPRSGGVSGAGRDHWTHSLSVVMAGGGIRGGQTYGSTDRLGEYPADLPVTPADIAKTVYRSMGVNNLEAYDRENRPYNLLAEGEALPLF
ncbi:MAG: DUF1501 domain-containing protein [Planctomycetales bacterium]|nr:DUF1501 domain-containing protein [Planctomycetales bacterium]